MACEPFDCDRCGQRHERCKGHVTKDDEGNLIDPRPCNKWPRRGSPVCQMHGGNAPQVIARAKRERNRQKAEAIVSTFGEAREGDPFELILEEIARTNGHVLWLADVVADLEQQDLVWGVTGTEQQDGSGASGSHSKTSEAAGVSVWLQLYQTERAHLLKACKDAIACGIAERQIQLAEQTGKVIAQVLRATLADPELGLPPDRQEVGLRVVSRHLRALPAA